jgi:hypothetical protein
MAAGPLTPAQTFLALQISTRSNKELVEYTRSKIYQEPIQMKRHLSAHGYKYLSKKINDKRKRQNKTSEREILTLVGVLVLLFLLVLLELFNVCRDY